MSAARRATGAGTGSGARKETKDTLSRSWDWIAGREMPQMEERNIRQSRCLYTASQACDRRRACCGRGSAVPESESSPPQPGHLVLFPFFSPLCLPLPPHSPLHLSRCPLISLRRGKLLSWAPVQSVCLFSAESHLFFF